MWESKYGKEPADLKLLALLYVRKIWILIVAAILGAIIGGTGYFVKHVVFAPAPTYVAHSMMYVDFVRGEDREPKYYTFNTAGWSGFVKTDQILDEAMVQLAADADAISFEQPITKEEMRASVDASVDADYRVIDLLVTNENPVKAVVIAHAVERAFPVFADEMVEIEQIRVMTSADAATRVWVDVATYRAVIWGAILASLVVFFVLLVVIAMDDAVYTPELIRKRYGIPVIGIFPKITNEKNLEFAKKLQMHMQQNRDFLCKEMEEKDIVYLPTEMKHNVLVYPELLKEIPEDTKGIILQIPYGMKNGKIVEETLGLLEQYHYRVLAAVLMDADTDLLRKYYFGSNLKS